MKTYIFILFFISMSFSVFSESIDTNRNYEVKQSTNTVAYESISDDVDDDIDVTSNNTNSESDEIVNISEGETFNVTRAGKQMDSIQNKMDTAFKLGGDILSIYKKTYDKFGLKKTIQLHSKVFFPLILFIILYLLYLRGKSK